MANNPDVRGCRSCGRNLNIAEDQTDWPPRENEVALDTAHMSPEPSHHDYYVCGRCIEKAEANNLKAIESNGDYGVRDAL